jgi:hypothetical protein
VSDQTLRPLLVCSAAILSFILFGLLLIPMAGLEVDEVMFAKALLVPRGGVAWFSFYHHYYPSMLMSYVGALKSFIYAPLAILAGPPLWPSVWAIRLPMLLLAAVTSGLAGRLMWRISGATAAVCMVCILGTDSSILLTGTFDWGPVVLQNCLLVSALLFSLAWRYSLRDRLLFCAALLAGLALWNKALFIWNLCGLAVALLLVAFRDVTGLWTWRRATLVGLGLALGSYPLLRYNIKDHGPTLRQNAHLGTNDVPAKVRNMAATINGQLAPIQLVDLRVKAADTMTRPFAAVSLRIADAFAAIPKSYITYLEMAVLVWGWFAANRVQRRWITFFALSFFISWIPMLATTGAGTSVHHTVLFLLQWYCAVALSLAAIAASGHLPRIVMMIVIAALSFTGWTSQNLIYANMLRFDAQPPWSNASEPLLSWMMRSGIKRTVLVDWGLSDVVTTLSHGQIAVQDVSGALNQGNFDVRLFQNCLAPECVIVSHAAGHAIFDNASRVFADSFGKLERTAGPAIAVEEKTFSDTHEMAVIEVFVARRAS